MKIDTVEAAEARIVEAWEFEHLMMARATEAEEKLEEAEAQVVQLRQAIREYLDVGQVTERGKLAAALATTKEPEELS